MKGLTLSSLWNRPWDRDLMQEVYWAKLLGTTPPAAWKMQGWAEREMELGCSHASLISQEALQSAPKLKQEVQALVCLHGPVVGCGCPWKGDNLGRGSFLHPGPILGKELSCETWAVNIPTTRVMSTSVLKGDLGYTRGQGSYFVSVP